MSNPIYYVATAVTELGENVSDFYLDAGEAVREACSSRAWPGSIFNICILQSLEVEDGVPYALEYSRLRRVDLEMWGVNPGAEE